MVRLLVINPNTSPQVSSVIDAFVKKEAGPAASVQTVTANFGFHYIASRSAVAIAGHAVLDAAAEAIAAGANPDAIVLACFGDPGLDALQEMTGLPSVGFAEAGLNAAGEQEGTFMVATRGQIWCDMLRGLIQKLGLQHRVCSIHSINENDDVGAIAASLAAAAKEGGASRIVVGGAGLIPLIPGLIEACPVPIFDPHRAAVRKAIQVAHGKSRIAGIRFQETTKGLSEPLRRLFSNSELALPPVGNAR